MSRELQYLFAQMLYSNQSYVDPSNVLNNVVDDSGYKVQVGEQQDSMEYLMNFMERLEEGVNEDSSDVTKHMRVSTYRKGSEHGDSASESFLTDSTDIAFSTSINDEEGKIVPGDPKLPGYSQIDDSYFQHAATQEKPPIAIKPFEKHTNTIYENFFGSHITVTKLLNKETNQEKVISKHCQKMGPIMLNIDNGRLMDDWEQSSRIEVSDYKAAKSEVCINESWMKEPPNTIVFTLNRVKYDKTQLKLAKDFQKFEFDKEIHVDQMMEGNIGRIEGVRMRTQRLKQEIKSLRLQLEACKRDTTLESLSKTLSFLNGQIDSKNGFPVEEVKQEGP